jgi:uncharacterized protein YebE (UPF0316 family)
MIDFQMFAMIVLINFAYIPLNTLQFMSTMKGYGLAPLVNMVEIIIYMVRLSLVLERLDIPIHFYMF